MIKVSKNQLESLQESLLDMDSGEIGFGGALTIDILTTLSNDKKWAVMDHVSVGIDELTMSKQYDLIVNILDTFGIKYKITNPWTHNATMHINKSNKKISSVVEYISKHEDYRFAL